MGLDLHFGLPDHIAIPHRVNPWAGDYNRDDVRVVEMPSANGIGTARSVAQLYGVAATGGRELGLAASTLDALAAPPISPSDGTRDRILNVDSAFSLGFCKPLPNFCFGSSGKAFGTPGFGGSFGFADPDTGVGFAYVMNRLGFHLYSDPRRTGTAPNRISQGTGRAVTDLGAFRPVTTGHQKDSCR